MEIKKLDKNELANFREVVAIFKTVFANDEAIAPDQHLTKLLANPDFMVFVVKVNNKVVGGLTIYILHRYFNEKPIAYIYDVGVEPSYQGKGFGKALIAEVCNFCKTNGFEDAYVEAESDDSDAVNFYRKTNATNEMNAIHFTYSFNN
ncbi:MAG: GNAT family N-acetyltransferase [Bacteroidia bacterium]